MILLHRARLLIAAAAAVLILSKAEGNTSVSCNQSCGKIAKSVNIRYPFGFSDGCPIKLSCHNESQIKIGEFDVFNVTQSSIFVRLPAQCNRTIDSISPLFGSNFAPTRINVFILQNCRSPLAGCFQRDFLSNPFGYGNCSAKSDNMTCFSNEVTNSEVIPFEEVNRTNCDFVLSSVVTVDSVGGLLQIQAIELGWWLNGPCMSVCFEDANCDTVTLPGAAMGTRCRCMESAEGDGYALGVGCRIVAATDMPDDEDVVEQPMFYLVVMLGFGSGLWGVLGALMFKNSWRAAYFKFVDDMIDKVYVVVKVKLNKLKRKRSSEEGDQ